MSFSQKTVYALRAVFELARRHGPRPTSIPVIAEVQGIPPRFLENILIQLKQAGLVESVRGKEGGYLLARAARDLTVGDVLRAIEGPMYPVMCLGVKVQESCPLKEDCVFLPMWREAQKAQLAVYDGTTFESLVKRSRHNEEQNTSMYAI